MLYYYNIPKGGWVRGHFNIITIDERCKLALLLFVLGVAHGETVELLNIVKKFVASTSGLA